MCDPLPTATGLFPFIAHEAHCLQAKQKDKHLWKTAHDANQAAPWGLTGYFLDPDHFQMLAHSARLQLPEEPLHIPTWRQAGCLTFHLQLSHILRVGHLQPLNGCQCARVSRISRSPCPMISQIRRSLPQRGGGCLLLGQMLTPRHSLANGAGSP